MREGIGPDGAVGCRLTDEHWSPDANTEDELAEAARVLSDAGLIDYLSVALGSSTTYRGSSWIVPPSPIEHNAILPFARRMKAASTVPVIATGRIVEAADANAMIERGDCDACGMTRAMITDPGDAGQGARRQAVHALHRLQPGMHRALPLRPPDRLHDQPLDRVRAAAPRLPRAARAPR